MDLLDVIAAFSLAIMVWSALSSMDITLTCVTLVQGDVD